MFGFVCAGLAPSMLRTQFEKDAAGVETREDAVLSEPVQFAICSLQLAACCAPAFGQASVWLGRFSVSSQPTCCQLIKPKGRVRGRPPHVPWTKQIYIIGSLIRSLTCFCLVKVVLTTHMLKGSCTASSFLLEELGNLERDRLCHLLRKDSRGQVRSGPYLKIAMPWPVIKVSRW